MKYTLAIDQSTSATKVLLFHGAGLRHKLALAHRQYYPQPGWVEHCPEEIWQNTLAAVRQLLSQQAIDASQIESLAITNQRETVVAWDKATGQPVYNAVAWQCNRGADCCNSLEANGYSDLIRQRTGLRLNPYFSASGMKWILDHAPQAAECAAADRLLFGTIDSWLIWRLTKGRVHATDYTNASRTLLFNIYTLDWDNDLLALFNIRRSMLPQVQPSDSLFGATTLDGLLPEIPIAGVTGDSHGALAGQSCFSAGAGKATYGTGSSLMVNIGPQALPAPEGLVTTIGFSMQGKIEYALEGNIHCTGAVIQWLVDEIGLLASAKESETAIVPAPDNGGVYLVPAFAGLGAPWWDAQARALLCGMTRGTTRAHIVRAALESIAYQVKDLADLIPQSGVPLKELRVDGGPVQNRFLMQFQADMLQIPLRKSAIEEASALGSILMNGLALGHWPSPQAFAQQLPPPETIAPQMPPSQRDALYQGWKQAIKRTLFK